MPLGPSCSARQRLKVASHSLLTPYMLRGHPSWSKLHDQDLGLYRPGHDRLGHEQSLQGTGTAMQAGSQLCVISSR